MDNTTNLMCRACYLGKKNMVNLLLSYGADLNLKCGGKGNTGLVWAVAKDSPKMVEFLIEKGADLEVLNNDDNNAIDVAVERMSFKAAKVLYKNGLRFKNPNSYKEGIRHPFDVVLFMEYVRDDVDLNSYAIFFEKIQQEKDAWLNRDLVLDPTETWKDWFVRNMNFEEPKMIPREDLASNKQPHKSIYGKLSSYVNGVNPYPPGHKKNPVQRHTNSEFRAESHDSNPP